MINYVNLTLPELYDLLAEETKRLSELIANHQFQNDEYLKCSNAIRKIQNIIYQKKGSSDTSSKKMLWNPNRFNFGV